MLRGIYMAAAGMLAEESRQEVVANNLANAGTTAFKREAATVRAGDGVEMERIADGGATPIGEWGGTVAPGPHAVDLRQGGLQPTGRPLDLALVGRGFFALETPAGVRYTRDGSLRVDREGYLVNADGHRVLGESGPIRVGDGEVAVSSGGEVTAGGQVRGRLRVVDFPASSLTREGGNLFRARDEAQGKPAAAKVQSGHLELANVHVVQEMVDLIAVMRAYEANQKLIRAQDETLGQLVSEVGKV